MNALIPLWTFGEPCVGHVLLSFSSEEPGAGSRPVPRVRPRPLDVSVNSAASIVGPMHPMHPMRHAASALLGRTL
jgi:hypothetical protein